MQTVAVAEKTKFNERLIGSTRKIHGDVLRSADLALLVCGQALLHANDATLPLKLLMVVSPGEGSRTRGRTVPQAFDHQLVIVFFVDMELTTIRRPKALPRCTQLDDTRCIVAAPLSFMTSLFQIQISHKLDRRVHWSGF